MDNIEREIVVAAPIERVWDIVSQPEHIGRWLGDAGGVAIDGDGIDMTWEAYGTVRLRIEREEPPRVFAFRWGPFGSQEPTHDNSTHVEFTLDEVEDGTRVKVVESGFTPDQASVREDHLKGWVAELGDLQRYAQTVAV
jgi:uncharacterized protein YndB with AHSA1/START domain